MSTNSSASYPPKLFEDYTIAFMGNSVGCLFYGIYVVIAVTNLVLLHRKRSHLLSFFTWSQLVNTTVYLGISLSIAPPQCLSIFGLLGPDVVSPWPEVMVDIAFVMNTWFSDAFLLYRCYVVWMGNKYAVGVPALVYLSTIGASVAYLWSNASPGTVYGMATVQMFGRPYWACSVAFKVVTTCLISLRLCLHRRTSMRPVGSHQGQFNVGFVGMIIESAVLYTAFAIVALVFFFLNNQLENIFFPILSMVQVIAPALIINRVARGMSFPTGNPSHSRVDVSTSTSSTRKNGVALRGRERGLSAGSATIQSHSSTHCQPGVNSTSFVNAVRNVV